MTDIVETPPVRLLKSGAPAHTFTPEERALGGVRTAEKRREAGKSVRERFAEKLEADADIVYASFRKAIQDGDWRAGSAILAEAFGKPVSQLELSGRVENNLSIVVQSALPTPGSDIELEAADHGSDIELDAGDVHELDADE